MSGKNLLTAGLIALGLLVAVGLLNRTPPAAAQGGRASGRYHVVANEKAFVLYDSVNGEKSWILVFKSTDKRHAWLPIKRLNSDAEVQNWRLIHSARQ